MCEHHHDHTEDDHHHGKAVHWLGKHTELYFALLSGTFLAVAYGLSFSSFSNQLLIIIYIISLFLGAFFTLQSAVEKLKRGKFEIDFLMIVAALGAVYLGKYAEGALLLFLFSLGHALEHYALGRAKKAIRDLGNLTPQVALVKRNKDFEQIQIGKLRIGDIILVKPYEQIAADGVIISGQGSVNQAPITGESMPVDKIEIGRCGSTDFESFEDKNKVFAGTLNGASPLEIKVLRKAAHSTVARMIKMVSEAQAKQSPTQHFTKRIEKYYVPAVLLLVFVLCFVFLFGVETFQESLYRAVTVLVASSPCALAISTPGTILSGIARGAQKGVLFKGGGALEDLGSVRAIAFDKTGTLTEGKPKVTEVLPYKISKEELLSLTMSIETFSNHPLAVAVVRYAKQFVVPLEMAQSKVKVVEGKGIEAFVGTEKIRVGRLSFLGIAPPRVLKNKILEFDKKGYTVVGIGSETAFKGIIALADKPKTTAFDMLYDLRKLGVEKLVMLTGDQQAVANTIGTELQIKEAKGGLLPEGKVTEIQSLNSRYEKTAMVGDGINDAPAMATATVALAMGAAGSDVALETADIALLSDNIQQIPFAVGLSRKAKSIIKQNLYISLGSIALLIPLAIANVTGIGITVLLHEGTTIVVILNALRLLQYRIKRNF